MAFKCSYQNRARKIVKKMRIHVGMNDKTTTVTPSGSNPSSNGFSMWSWTRVCKHCSLAEQTKNTHECFSVASIRWKAHCSDHVSRVSAKFDQRQAENIQKAECRLLIGKQWTEATLENLAFTRPSSHTLTWIPRGGYYNHSSPVRIGASHPKFWESKQSSSQTHTVGNVGIFVNFVFPYVTVFDFFVPFGVGGPV